MLTVMLQRGFPATVLNALLGNANAGLPAGRSTVIAIPQYLHHPARQVRWAGVFNDAAIVVATIILEGNDVDPTVEANWAEVDRFVGAVNFQRFLNDVCPRWMRINILAYNGGAAGTFTGQIGCN